MSKIGVWFYHKWQNIYPRQRCLEYLNDLIVVTNKKKIINYEKFHAFNEKAPNSYSIYLKSTSKSIAKLA